MNEKEFTPAEMEVTDYTDPQCPFCVDAYKKDNVKPIDAQRVIAKLDEYLGHNDYAGAERHLKYWEEEAKQGNDLRGEFTIAEELMGLYRKLGRREEAISYAEKAVRYIDLNDLSGSVSAATAMLNAATVYKAFGQAEKGIPLFEKAQAIYEQKLPPEDSRLAGLYNNFALALVDLSRFDEARALYQKALDIVLKQEGNEPEAAITFLNLASLAEREFGLEKAEKEIEGHLEHAEYLLKKPGLRKDGNYAFVAEKCAPVFGYYGWFGVEAELKAEAERIYGGKE
ncbi:MAG: tetratricopeptide repeat protein [Clostridia bacterium]|nr:tetratricopeptide repeat protein [Clostridia bacterium]